jgi:hypothetical protein
MAVFCAATAVLWADEAWETTAFVFWANDAGAAQKANAATTGSSHHGILFIRRK